MKLLKLLKPGDYLIFIVNITAIIVFSLIVYGGNASASVVLIETDSEQWIYSLDEDRVEHIHGKQGDTIVEIKDGKVHIADSPCPDKLCVQMGWLEKTNDWAACLPNGVFVTVQGERDDGIDAISQ
jgi:hypothetical protein